MLGLLTLFCISLGALGYGRANALNILNSSGNSPRNVTYDHGAIIIDGKPRILISGSIHYPRSTPEVRERKRRHRFYDWFWSASMRFGRKREMDKFVGTSMGNQVGSMR